MNRQEFAKGIKIIELGYNTRFDEEKLEFWYKKLCDMSFNEYYKNINELMKTSTYIPNIAQIRGEEKECVYKNYEQRKYDDIDFEKFYAN